MPRTGNHGRHLARWVVPTNILSPSHRHTMLPCLECQTLIDRGPRCTACKRRRDRPRNRRYDKTRKPRPAYRLGYVDPLYKANRLVVLANTVLCSICNSPLGGDREIDHILPLSKGGGNELANLRAVHPACNQARRRSHPPRPLP